MGEQFSGVFYFFLIFQYESFFESKNESTKAIVVKSCKMFLNDLKGPLQAKRFEFLRSWAAAVPF